MDLLERLTAPGPKRILAIDGGGIRGAVALGYLQRIETLLRVRHGNPDLLLRDYFDLIGGTSTGAMIAGAAAIGMEASEIRRFYETMGPSVFDKKTRLRQRLKSLFDPVALDAELKAQIGDVPLGDPSITTGICIVAMRADTRSKWPLINHPNGKYFAQNQHIMLRQAMRASAAAPVAFLPEAIDVGGGEVGAFVDGGVSTALNPALLLLLIATLNGFPFHWDRGEDELLLVSVGTGTWSDAGPASEVLDRKLWNWATQVPGLLLHDIDLQNQLLLQAFSRSKTPRIINSEFGDLADDLLSPEPLLTYLRYNLTLDGPTLIDLGLPELAPRAIALRDMADGSNVRDLGIIGDKACVTQVDDAHFPAAFDL